MAYDYVSREQFEARATFPWNASPDLAQATWEWPHRWPDPHPRGPVLVSVADFDRIFG